MFKQIVDAIKSKGDFRILPSTVVPLKYHLSVQPDLKTNTFQGQVLILIRIKRQTSNIVLNSSDLDIKIAKLRLMLTDYEKRTVIPNITLNADDETLKLSFKEPLDPAMAELLLIYEGKLRTDFRGFYRTCRKTEDDDDERGGVATHFEPTSARRCFPCWDEPKLKAKFNISITAPAYNVVISNMPVQSAIEKGDLVEHRFKETPVMSSYQVAMSVGPWEGEELMSECGVLVRLLGPPASRLKSKPSLLVASQALEFFSCYFALPYVLPKLDLLAVEGFLAGTMENWGLVVCRDTAVLFIEEQLDFNTKYNAIKRVAHAVAHQWFGNLVTMDWWNNLWLKEGISTYMEYVFLEQNYLKCDAWNNFLYSVHFPALEVDSLKSTHPIDVHVQTTEEIHALFDKIAYYKGAAIIRMLHYYVGDVNFRDGIKTYLSKFRFSSSSLEDFSNCMELVSHFEISEILVQWTTLPGYPLLFVDSPNWDNVNKTLRLIVKQSKFHSTRDVERDSDKWIVPVTFLKNDGTKKPFAEMILLGKNETVVLEGVAQSEWVKLNCGGKGFYRVEYCDTLRNLLMKNFSQLPKVDRANLMSDFVALVKAGKMSTVSLLAFLGNLWRAERSYWVWAEADKLLWTVVRHLAADSNCWQQLKLFVRHVYTKPANSLLRNLLITRLGDVQCPSIIIRAKDLLGNFEKRKYLTASRAPLYSVLAASAEFNTLEGVMVLHSQLEDDTEKLRFYSAMGHFPDYELIAQVLYLATSDQVAPRHYMPLLVSVSHNVRHGHMAWEYLRDHWEFFESTYKSLGLEQTLYEGILTVVRNLTSTECLMEVEQFFMNRIISRYRRRLMQVIEQAKVDSHWIRTETSSIKEFLRNYCSELERKK